LTWYEYDNLNHRTATHLPAQDGTSAVTETRYNETGQRWMEIDADGKATAFVKDGQGQLKWVITDVDPSLTALPDPAPTDRSGWESWAKSPNRTVSESTATQYEHDELGRLKVQTDANGNQTLFEYDTLGRMTRKTLPGGSLYETWTYGTAAPLVAGFKANS